MPLYMDIHQLEGVTAEELAKAHAADLATQKEYGVEYLKYWFNESCGKAFCLVHAPNRETANKVHREAHGLLAEKLIEVQPEIAEGFFGGTEISPWGAVLMPGGKPDERDPGIRTVLFTDIVESTSLTQRLGDEAAMDLIDLHDRIVRRALADSGGREVKHMGDGMLTSFVSAAAAVKCASQIQLDLAKHRAAEADCPLQLRIGIASGEPVEHHSDLFGSTVQLAARLCSTAAAEQILVSNVVAELCLGKKVRFQDLGALALKGFEQPIRAHAVDWRAEIAP
jgi:class 3 adenylate cyclase